MADLDNGVPVTEIDKHKLNLKIEKTNKLNHGASTAGIQTIKMAANQTTSWVPDKMAAYQTRTAWIPDVNNEDRCSEKSAEKHKRKLFIKYNYAHKIYKIGNNTKYHNCRHYTSLRKVLGTKQEEI